jgi:sulfide:quinone oxidoreductase
MKSHYQILIIGGGSGGIMTAANLLSKDQSLDIGIIEPKEWHFYQPAWTLVGAGTFDFEKTKRSMASVMPKAAEWIQDYAIGFKPELNAVLTQTNGSITYDYLVVSPGLVMAPELIEGLPEALDSGVACSNYTDPKYTWELLQNFKGGNAVFTQPTTPIKCGGAPQKIAYLAADYFKKNKLSEKTNVVFATPGSVIFGVKEIRETLMKVIGRYGIHFKPFYSPIKIDSANKLIHFKHTDPDENKCFVNERNILGEQSSPTVDEVIVMPFDLLHLAPPQTAPKFVRESKLVNETGWLDVDKHSLQHNRFPNIFGIGDVAALPTAKTGAAIRKQVPVVSDNILQLITYSKKGNKSYNGYSSCPLVTGYGKMVLAEFDYDGNFIPDPKLKRIMVFNSEKEHWRLWMLKKYGLPHLYWNKMMKGKEV